MVESVTRRGIRSLLAKLDRGDDRVPITELVDLTDTADVDVVIDRAGDPTVVYLAPRRDPVFRRLSPRELEVANLVATGLSNRAIAARLFISPSTVKDHVHAILEKTGLHSRASVTAAWHGSGGD